ncbi:MAG TPA: ABC transporter permease, partial [Agromyces sp.]|nr:ABC transporter permease [Agromyces sp.]
MNLARTFATAGRVLEQIRHDPRTVALLLVVPSLLIGLVAWMFTDTDVFATIGPAMLALFPFIVMFLVTSVAVLRERTSGTLERLLTTPLGKLDLLLGYAIAFGAVAVVQVGLASAVALWFLDLDVVGSPWVLVLFAVIDAVMGMALGLFLSAFASTEF